ncbi:hypothetical protein SAMN02745824_1042 [Parasphingorhabdus marina DSM 22363]|uniref:Uncharacterized protein n=2 Tax=Parasphingorhabdus marina TaxID=394732 RepID=A0A1N6CUY7_9SPHN|nr:hypothetical protein SAMN02745824_1042 [Parasphingorhabdus marina DSM 22363]
MTHEWNRTFLITAIIGLGAISAVSAHAKDKTPDYRATAMEPISDTIIARETVWRCTNGECLAKKSHSSARHVCVRLVREVGKLEKFSFRDASFDADKLAKCNDKAR